MKWRNIFEKVAQKTYDEDHLLGSPAADKAQHDRRMSLWAELRGGKGFRVPPKQPKVDKLTKDTRGERKRAMREVCAAKVSEQVPPEHVHPRRFRIAA